MTLIFDILVGFGDISGTEELSKPPQPLNAGDGTNHFPEDDDDNSSEYQAR